jgi:hypothetical protein
MEEILRRIKEDKFETVAALDAGLVVYGGSRSEFSDYFAKEIAERYLSGSINFGIADWAINALSVWMPLEDFPSYSWAVYRAFDEGEYLHQDQAIGSNEEVYTRPLLRKAMSDFFS